MTVQRNTKQREALLKVLSNALHPLGPQEITEKLRRSIPSISLSTVYRNLRVLLEEGVVAAVPVVGCPDRYELHGKAHHHHFHCDRCDRVFDLHGCVKGFSNLLPPGFKLTSHHLQLNGLCARCSTP